MDASLKDAPNSSSQSSALKIQRILTFVLTAFLYSTVHASRTAWAYVKPSLSDDLNFTDEMLSILDSSFLCAYAIGLYLSGWLGDRVKLKTMLGRGMLSTVLSLSVIIYFLGYKKTPSLAIGVFAFIINGLGQSTGFPGCIAILTNWFPAGEKGLIFGAWLINVNFGNILGQQIGRICVDTLKLEWFYAVIISTSILFIATVLMLNLLIAHPSEFSVKQSKSSGTSFFNFWRSDSGKSATEKMLDQETPLARSSSTQETVKDYVPGQRGIGFWEAWKAPGVFLYSLVFICVKSALYGLLFWLPMYLRHDVGFNQETAGLLASLEIGELMGVMLLGYISDRLNNRSWTITISLFFAVIVFFGISWLNSVDQKMLFYSMLFLAGIFIGGPAGMIVSTVSSELGDERSKGSKRRKVKSTSTITGIIDGSGTIGAAITQLIIPHFKHGCFIYYTVLCLVAAILTPLAHRQIVKSKRPYKEVEIEIESK